MSCKVLWSALDKARVPGSVAVLMPMVAEEEVTFAKDALGGSADSGDAVLAPSVAALGGPLERPVAGLAEAAAGFTGLPAFQEMLAAVARGEVALPSPGVTSWDGSTAVACGSAELLPMLGGDVPVLCSSWGSNGTVVHAGPTVFSAVTASPSCTNSLASVNLPVTEEDAFVPGTG